MTVEELLQNIKRKLDLDEIRLDTQVIFVFDGEEQDTDFEIDECTIQDDEFRGRILTLS